jgi:hypothetical protein
MPSLGQQSTLEMNLQRSNKDRYVPPAAPLRLPRRGLPLR